MLRILFISPLMRIGGEELSTLTLTREMIKRGHKVFVLGNEGEMTPEFIKTGATVIRSGQYARNPRAMIRDMHQMRGIIERESIDLVHSQSALPTLVANLACRSLDRGQTKPKVIFHERGMHTFSYPILCPILNFLTNHIITNSDYERRKLMRNGLRRKHCTRVHNCINLETTIERQCKQQCAPFTFQPGTTVLATVCRLVREKGITYLLSALKKVLETDKKVILLVVGDGPDRGMFERQAVKLDIADNVIFTGFRRDLHNIYSLLDIFLLCTTWESFGNVALEAAAHAKPVILSNVGGLPETTINGKTGVLVAPRCPKQIADAILLLIGNPGLSAKMGIEGQKRVVSYFNAQRVGDEVESIYYRLLDQR